MKRGRAAAKHMQLTAGDFEALVGLGVRAERDTVVTSVISHRDQVLFQHITIDHQTRSLNVGRQPRPKNHRDIVPDSNVNPPIAPPASWFENGRTGRFQDKRKCEV